jgi:hypothetical protein
MREILIIMIFMVLEFISGAMTEFMKENGIGIKCRGKEKFNGATEDNTKETILRIKNRATGFLSGVTEENMRATGSKANNMEEVSTALLMGRKRKENGSRERE